MRVIVTVAIAGVATAGVAIAGEAPPAGLTVGASPIADLLIDADSRMAMSEIVRAVRSVIAIEQPEANTSRTDDVLFSDSGLMDGAVLTIGAVSPGPASSGEFPADWLAEIRLVAGPQSGRIMPLAIGETVWGIDAHGNTACDSAIVPGSQSVVVLLDIEGKVTVGMTPSAEKKSQSTTVGAVLLEQDLLTANIVEWPTGAQLHLGDSVLTVQPLTVGTAKLMSSPDGGWLDYNRQPRLLPPIPVSKFRLPAPPVAPTRNPMPWLTAAIPMVLGVSMAILMKQPYYLLFALMSPVMMIGSNVSARRNGKKSHRRLLGEHHETMAGIQHEIADAVGAEQSKRRSTTPDAAELLRMATLPTNRLWERRNTDPDHLLIRVGIADLPSRVELEDLTALEHRRRSTGLNHGVPVTLSVATSGVIGVAGQGEWPRRIGAWIVGQLSVMQSPRDLQIYILGASDAAQSWHWARWLPHLRPALGQDALALIGTDTEAVGRRIAELGSLIAERAAAGSAVGAGSKIFSPDVLVVLDGARRLRALPGIVALLRDGPEVGIHVLCLDAEERQLPEECSAVVVEHADGTAVVRQHNAEDIEGVIADQVVEEWFDQVARSLAPLRDVSPSDGDSLLPAAANLLEVLGLESPSAEAIRARWATGGRSTEAVIGVSLDGPFSIDLVRDGPHGLVAGTTGSGKSEFLQTLVAALAVANRPDSMTFVLIDYKGGAAFSECADLPHTVGMVTDLDSHLVQRALNSLRAELIRREEMLGEVGAKDLDAYESHIVATNGVNLPRLVIVIDEFAAMAKELPDFVAGLISIAQRGRSLGVHLVMATQRPSGVISPEIRANTNLRIALRMTDAGESSDVIDIPDASRIQKTTPGRAYARLGHASIIPFQTARIGGELKTGGMQEEMRAPFVARLAADGFSRQVPRPPRAGDTASGVTELSVLVSSIRQASDGLGIPLQHSPWLPALPKMVLLAQPDLTERIRTTIGWAREDLPEQQVQQDAVIDFARFGHLYIVGAPGSGRSQALRTIAVSAVLNSTVTDLHLYGIDCGNGALSSLATLSACGAITQRNQVERSARLIQRLEAEVFRRHELLGTGNFANVAEQRRLAAPADRLPHILVLIDRWENFVTSLGELDGGAVMDTVSSLLRDAASAGVHFVISGDRSLLTSRMGALTEEKVILRLTDRLDYGLADINYKLIPTEIAAGRGFRSGSGRELQVAILGADASGQAQAEAVRQLGAQLTERDLGIPRSLRPFRVDDLPDQIDIGEALVLAAEESTGPMWALLGVGGDQLLAHGMDLEHDAPTFVVAGPARSGRSTLLATMADSLLAGGTELVVVCPRTSPLRDFAGLPGVRAVITGTDLTEDELAPHLTPDGTPVVLIVDDGEMLMDAPARTWLRAFIRTAADHRRALILGGNSAELCAGFTGWQVDVKKNRRGALLSPQNTVDGDLVGARVARSMVSPKIVPGRALVHLGSGEFTTLQIPARPPRAAGSTTASPTQRVNKTFSEMENKNV